MGQAITSRFGPCHRFGVTDLTNGILIVGPLLLGLLGGIFAARRDTNQEDAKAPEFVKSGLSPEDVSKFIWDHATKQDEYIITQFGVAIIGIGALFFAFGELKGQAHLQELVSLIGMGASIVVWMHSWGARVESRRAWRAVPDDGLRDRLRWVRNWRNQEWFAWFYLPVTELIVYFSGLVALAWLNLFLWSVHFLEFGALVEMDLAILWGLAVFAFTRRYVGIQLRRAKATGSAPPGPNP